MAALLSSDTWLAQVLGFPCFRLSSPASPADVPALVDELNRQVSGSAFAYVKVATRAVNSAAIFTDNGFNVVDVSVTFERPPRLCEPPRRPNNVVVRTAAGEDFIHARDIASQCMVYSRFHMDPHISLRLGNAINFAWMDSYANGQRGEKTYVAEVDGEIVGFNAVLRDQAGPQTCRVIDLIGVRPTAHRQGIGQALMEKFIDETNLLKMPMRVTTQVANIPAVNLYQRNGFRLIDSMLVLHKHFP